MDVEIIKCMISDSTWNSPDKKAVYNFINDNNLSINGRNLIKYSLKANNDNIILQIGSEKKYNVKYINDFVLELHNSNESFRLIPE